MPASASAVQSNAAFCEKRVFLGVCGGVLNCSLDLVQKIHCYFLVLEWDCTPCVLLTLTM